MTNRGANNLRWAIVKQAIRDYHLSLLHIAKTPEEYHDYLKRVRRFERKIIKGVRELTDVSRVPGIEFEQADGEMRIKKNALYKKLEKLEAAEKMKRECERFFYGEWFGQLCELDPDIIVNGVKQQVAEKTNNYPEIEAIKQNGGKNEN